MSLALNAISAITGTATMIRNKPQHFMLAPLHLSRHTSHRRPARGSPLAGCPVREIDFCLHSPFTGPMFVTVPANRLDPRLRLLPLRLLRLARS